MKLGLVAIIFIVFLHLIGILCQNFTQTQMEILWRNDDFD